MFPEVVNTDVRIKSKVTKSHLKAVALKMSYIKQEFHVFLEM